MSSDRIILSNLVFFGRHGCLPSERELAQKFRVSVELQLDLSPAGRTDDAGETIDWAELHQAIKAIVEERRFNLTEAVAEAIAGELLQHDRVTAVKVRVEKPDAPVSGLFDFLGVEIVRTKGGLTT